MTISVRSSNKKIEMHNTLSILLIEDQQLNNSILKSALITEHHHILNDNDSSLTLAEKCMQYHPDILIINTNIPTQDTLKELAIIDQLAPLPVLIYAKQETQSLIKLSIKAGVSAYIVNKDHSERLVNLITLACERFKQRQSLRDELNQTKTQLANRKIVERAKGYIMQHKSLSEQEAFNLLRQAAMNKGQTLAIVSKNIADTYDLLN
ncbi:ANTAR domain-containing protein [Psychromonas sp. RZ22]|uniref:ANTAR domain-containing response regulator n=1 Tax=Psychromonas algarum TaxID=2555643 RepID=UPI0010676054|nr:ANTAR domain-containing protein [Psychromonas sp. RZ22]TEW55280.1 ANTAR domain-containing protein [Psychromonas sp. RZ22]